MMVYLISMGKAVDRREYMVNQLSRLAIPHRIVEAFDGEEPYVQEVADVDRETVFRAKHRRDPYPGEIGCYYSHLSAMEFILSLEEDYGIIMEDDVQIYDNFVDVDERLRSNEVKGWDMFYLCQEIFGKETVRSKDKGEWWHRLNSGRVGTQCYAVSHRFAHWFLNNKRTMRRALDWEFWWCGKLPQFNFYDLIPPHRVCRLAPFDSLISKGGR